MGEVSVAENGLAPVYIIGSHTLSPSFSLSLSLFSPNLLLLQRTLEKDYGEATLSILVVFFTLIFIIIIVLVPDSSPNLKPHPSCAPRQTSEARPVSHDE